MMLTSLYDSYKDNIEQPYKEEFKKNMGMNPSSQKPQATFGIVTSEGYSLMKIGMEGGSTTIRSSSSKLKKKSKREESLSDIEDSMNSEKANNPKNIFKRRRGG
jgi:hypothetical protein